MVEKASTQHKGPSGIPIEFGDQTSLERRCSRESHHPAEGASGPPIEQFGDRRVWRQGVVEKASTQQNTGPPGLRLSNPGERERNADGQ